MDKKQLVKLIKAFVEQSYGTPEVEDPSWDINKLAAYIVKNYK